MLMLHDINYFINDAEKCLVVNLKCRYIEYETFIDAHPDEAMLILLIVKFVSEFTINI